LLQPRDDREVARRDPGRGEVGAARDLCLRALERALDLRDDRPDVAGREPAHAGPEPRPLSRPALASPAPRTTAASAAAARSQETERQVEGGGERARGA